MAIPSATIRVLPYLAETFHVTSIVRQNSFLGSVRSCRRRENRLIARKSVGLTQYFLWDPCQTILLAGFLLCVLRSTFVNIIAPVEVV